MREREEQEEGEQVVGKACRWAALDWREDVIMQVSKVIQLWSNEGGMENVMARERGGMRLCELD